MSRPPLSAFLQKQKEEEIDVKVLRGKQGDKGDSPSKEELEALIKPLIPEPKDGKTPSKQELLSLIKPLIPDPIKGDNGITPPLEELEAIVLSLLPEPEKVPELAPKDLIEKINKAKTAKISKSRVEGMDELDGLARSANRNVQNILSLGGSRQTIIKNNGALTGTGVTTINFTGGTVTKVGNGEEISVPLGGAGGGQVNSVVAGSGISVDSTDPANPIVSSTSSGGTVTSVTSADANATVATTTTTPVITIVSAPKLQTARAINGVNFDGTAAITVTAAAGTLTGTTLNSTVVSSSLTSVGTLANLTVTNPIAGSVTGNAATVTTNANLTGPVTSTGNATAIANSINLPASPTTTTQTPADNSTKIATTAYVDAAVLGQNFKEAAKYATTAALATVVYANGSSGVGATLTAVGVGALSLDGSTPSVSDRILVKNQASTFQNGIYTVTIVGTGATVFVLTRSLDANQTGEFKTGDSIFVTSGTANGSTTWAYTGIDSPTIGTDAITYAQTAGQGTVTAGNGITVTGLSVAIDTGVTVDKTTAQTLTNKTLTTPIIASISNGGTVTVPSGADTLVARTSTDTLTNKTFDTAGTGNSFSINGVAASANTGTGAVARAASPTFTGLVTSAKMLNTGLSYGTEFSAGNSGTSITIDWTANGNFQTVTRTGNCTYTFTAPTGPTTLVLRMVHEASATVYTNTFSPVPKWAGGTVPTPTNTTGAIDVITFYYDGTSYYGSALAAFA